MTTALPQHPAIAHIPFVRFQAGAARTIAMLALALFATAFQVREAPAQSPTLTGTWTARPLAGTPSGAPSGRGWIDLIYDPVARRPVLFGGSGNTYRNDILEIDFAGTRWVEIEPHTPNVAPSTPPCPRDEHAVEYDAYNGFYWSFGGSGYACNTRTSVVGAGSAGAVVVDATLTESTVDYYRDWLVTILAGPGPFYAYVTAYNPVTKALTLNRSFTGSPVGLTYSVRPQGGGGTWYYDPVAGTWHSFEDPAGGYTGDRPLSRLSPAMAYSTADDVMVMFGGQGHNDTWLLDAQTKSWLLARGDGWPGNPPRRSQITNAMAYDSANGVFVLFGGTCADGSGCGAVPYDVRLADTWIYRISTNTWTQTTPAVSPPARQQHTLSYDPVQGVLVLYGGIGHGGPLQDVWTYHVPTNTWRQVSVNTGPVARRIHAMVYDPTLGEHVVYGGVQASGASLWDTWSLRLALQGTNAAPTASFTVSPSSGTVGTTFAFNGSTSSDPDGTIVSHAWQFGDGTTGSGVTTTHQYASPGTFTVTLTVTDNLGAFGSSTAQVVVNPSGTGLANGGFETPALAAGAHQYQPAGGTWLFGPGTGIQRNGSAWSAPSAPQGQQTAFLQGSGAQISQVVNFAAGTYTVSFSAARRAYQGAGQPLQLSVDGVPVGSPILPASTAFATYTTASFTVTAGTHTLAFTTSNPDGDNSSFLDNVVVNPAAGGQAPAFTSAATTTFSVGQAGTFTVQASGVPTPTLSASGALPAGVTFVDQGNGTATLGGTPAAGTAGTYPLSLTAANGVGSNAVMSFTLIVNPSGTGLANGGFETPALAAGAHQYQPAGGTWLFGPGTGIQRNGSAWSAPSAPQGQQTAFLQGSGAQISQVVNFAAGTYTVSFSAARRAYQGAGQPLQLSVDGVAVGSPILPASTAFATYTTASFTVTAGAHTLAFTTSNPDGDNSSFLDNVVVNPAAGGQAPAFTSAATTTFSVGQAGTFTVQASGVPTPTLSASGALPAGVTFVDQGSGTATLGGTPAAGTAGTYPLSLTAANGVGSNAVMSFTLIVNPSGTGLANGGFETPALAAGAYQYQPTGGTWAFGPGTGIQRNGSLWGAQSAPEGQQTAFLQGGGVTLSQVVSLSADTYTISFSAARRSFQGAGQPLQLSVDGVAVGSPILPASTAFATYTTASFTVTAGAHTLAFTTSNPVGDNSSFLDDVRIDLVVP